MALSNWPKTGFIIYGVCVCGGEEEGREGGRERYIMCKQLWINEILVIIISDIIENVNTVQPHMDTYFVHHLAAWHMVEATRHASSKCLPTQPHMH